MKQERIKKVETGTCQLYRHFAADGTLLYVGISLSAVQRLSGHKGAAGWVHMIHHMTVQNFASRKDAARAEIAAIKAERPLFNKAHRLGSRRATPQQGPIAWPLSDFDESEKHKYYNQFSGEVPARIPSGEAHLHPRLC